MCLRLPWIKMRMFYLSYSANTVLLLINYLSSLITAMKDTSLGVICNIQITGSYLQISILGFLLLSFSLLFLCKLVPLLLSCSCKLWIYYSYVDRILSHRFEQAKSHSNQWEFLTHYNNQYKLPRNTRADWLIHHE